MMRFLGVLLLLLLTSQLAGRLLLHPLSMGPVTIGTPTTVSGLLVLLLMMLIV